MFSNGFPKEWSTLKKLIWLKAKALAHAVLKTIIGNPIHITDALAKPVQALSVKLEPVQDLHGYDNPWPAGGGANLLDPDERTSSTQNIYFYHTNGFLLKENQTYTFSVYSSENAAGLCIHKLSDNSALAVKYNGKTVTYTPTEDVLAWFDVYYSPSPTGGTANINVQLELGSTSTAWTPYSNLCPITGHTGVNVTRTGKNLLKYPYMTPSGTVGNISVTVNQDGTLTYSGTNASVKWFGFYGANSTTVSQLSLLADLGLKGGDTVTITNGSTGRFVFQFNKADGTPTTPASIVKDGIGSTTGTIPSDAVYAYIGLRFSANTAYSEENVGFQIELGSTATAYSPYVGTTYPIPLGQTVYGGTLDVLTGVLTVTWASILLNEFSFDGTSSPERHIFRATYRNIIPNVKVPESDEKSWDALCSSYGYKPYSPISGTDDGKYAIAIGVDRIVFIDHRCNTVNEFEQLNASVQLVYPLATPTTIQLTPTQVELLQGEINIWSDGEMTLVYLADGNASDVEALNILLGNRYVNNHGEDEPTDREALDILLGGTR